MGGSISLDASISYTAEATETGFSYISLGIAGSPTAGAGRDIREDRLTEAWVLQRWIENITDVSDVDSDSCACYQQWHAWCTRYYTGLQNSQYPSNIALDPDNYCVDCTEFCLANRVLALGEEVGLLAPNIYEIAPESGTWLFTSKDWGRAWVAPYGSLAYVNATLMDYLGTPNGGAIYYYLASPENDPTREVVWTDPYDNYNSTLVLLLLVTFAAWTVSAAFPVYDKSTDEYLGEVMGDMYLSQLTDLLNGIQPTPSGFSMLLTASGCVVSAPQAAYKVLYNEEANFTAGDWKCLSEALPNFTQVKITAFLSFNV